ncbi:MAG: epoxyqueuosine reductase QueH [Bacteroidales bacterium]|nr:epoxyqueuosine reductase QueH [Bacteroidales bacterium]
MESLILHCCCAPCSAAIIEWLLDNHISPVLFFFNPNIYPLEEYEIRKNELKRYAEKLNVEFVDADYDHTNWLEKVKGLEQQPERGSRCLECFKMRLAATARFASERGITRIATTLASSRWKNLEQIAIAGQWAVSLFPELTFWEKNWRKGGLSERRLALLQENGFYNQKYCGCEFSHH